MNTLTGIILLFAIGAHTVIEAASIPTNLTEAFLNRVKRQPFFPQDFLIEKSDLPKINKLRRDFSRQTGIATPDLRWDDRMLSKIYEVSSDCENEDQGYDFRYFRAGPDEMGLFADGLFYVIVLMAADPDKIPNISENAKEELHEFRKTLEENTHKVSLRLFEVFNPDQTMIACKHHPCRARIPDEFLKSFPGKLPSNQYSYSQVCALGPTGQFNDKTMNLVKNNQIQAPGIEGGLRQTKVEVKQSAPLTRSKIDPPSKPSGPSGLRNSPAEAPSAPPASSNSEAVKSSVATTFSGALFFAAAVSIINMII